MIVKKPMFLGDKQRFAVEIGDFVQQSPALRRVDIWDADRWWTFDDNTAHTLSF